MDIPFENADHEAADQRAGDDARAAGDGSAANEASLTRIGCNMLFDAIENEYRSGALIYEELSAAERGFVLAVDAS